MTEKRIYGVLAEFTTASGIFHACEKIRDAKFERWDAHTPFPVHGLERAIGLSRSGLPYFVFAMGLTGALGALALQYWVSVVAYPIIIAAKPYFSWQAFIPVTFESMVLFAAGSAVIGMLFLNRLPRWHNPLFTSERFARASDDRFFISIDAKDPKFDRDQTIEFLRSLGASHVEMVEE